MDIISELSKITINDVEYDIKDATARASIYTHPIGAGYKHIPAGGVAGQILRYSSDGTAVWGEDGGSGSSQVQADWNQSNNAYIDYIKNKPVNVSAFNNDAGYLDSFTETDPTVPSWAKTPTKPTYTAQEVGALPSNTSIPSTLAGLTDDATHRLVTDAEKISWADFTFAGGLSGSGDLNDCKGVNRYYTIGVGTDGIANMPVATNNALLLVIGINETVLTQILFCPLLDAIYTRRYCSWTGVTWTPWSNNESSKRELFASCGTVLEAVMSGTSDFSFFARDGTTLINAADRPSSAEMFYIVYMGDEAGGRRKVIAYEYSGGSNLYTRDVFLGSWINSWNIVFTGSNIIPIANGGTGTNNAADALLNLGALPLSGMYSGSLDSAPSGFCKANASTNYPIGTSGVGVALTIHYNTTYAVQIYQPLNINAWYYRNKVSSAWSTWAQLFGGNSAMILSSSQYGTSDTSAISNPVAGQVYFKVVS